MLGICEHQANYFIDGSSRPCYVKALSKTTNTLTLTSRSHTLPPKVVNGQSHMAMDHTLRAIVERTSSQWEVSLSLTKLLSWLSKFLHPSLVAIPMVCLALLLEPSTRVRITSIQACFNLAYILPVRPQRAKTFFENVVATLDKPLFGAYLPRNADGSYSFGVPDSSKFTGSLTYTDIDTSSGFWECKNA
jgi:hypothetical protein